ncbi:MAG: ATP-binding protein [Candidatus Omnitrophota bacterium]|nr:ATP-binding protein [Candidatus Omnitrophota bacterium]
MEFLTNIFQGMVIEDLFNLGGLAVSFAAVTLALILMSKIDQIQQLKKSLEKLKRAFDELDEQAKLIVKTDLALNKTQEELDKKVASLYTLHKISRLISTTLDEDEIFRRINEQAVSELGFEKGLIIMRGTQEEFSCKVCVGYPESQIENLVNTLRHEAIFSHCLREGRSLSSFNLIAADREKISRLFLVTSFLATPILTQDGISGVLFLGNASGQLALTEGDEELISILANQLGQSLENAKLFEEAFHSKLELESKIHERTKELSNALEEVKRISKMKSEFISAVSHELRTPLTSIKGYASILMAGKVGEIPAAVKERLDKINKHSDSLVKLINDLLDITRIESGKAEMKLEPHHINEIIYSVTDLLQPQLKEKEIQFKTEVSQDLPSVLIDRDQIERVFINLLGNAIKFTPSGGWIKISAVDKADFMEVAIADSGIGISEQDIPKIFEEFYRVDNQFNQTLKGTGLGLSLVKYIVEAHQGKIWVNSQLNKGSVFYFTLPKLKK